MRFEHEGDHVGDVFQDLVGSHGIERRRAERQRPVQIADDVDTWKGRLIDADGVGQLGPPATNIEDSFPSKTVVIKNGMLEQRH